MNNNFPQQTSNKKSILKFKIFTYYKHFKANLKSNYL